VTALQDEPRRQRGLEVLRERLDGRGVRRRGTVMQRERGALVLNEQPVEMPRRPLEGRAYLRKQNIIVTGEHFDSSVGAATLQPVQAGEREDERREQRVERGEAPPADHRERTAGEGFEAREQRAQRGRHGHRHRRVAETDQGTVEVEEDRARTRVEGRGSGKRWHRAVSYRFRRREGARALRHTGPMQFTQTSDRRPAASAARGRSRRRRTRHRRREPLQ
jgi:hypothetical protein